MKLRLERHFAGHACKLSEHEGESRGGLATLHRAASVLLVEKDLKSNLVNMPGREIHVYVVDAELLDINALYETVSHVLVVNGFEVERR